MMKEKFLMEENEMDKLRDREEECGKGETE